MTDFEIMCTFALVFSAISLALWFFTMLDQIEKENNLKREKKINQLKCEIIDETVKRVSDYFACDYERDRK